MLFDRHHPELEWRTIIDAGNPQTLVWRRVVCESDGGGGRRDCRRDDTTYADEFVDGVPGYFCAASESVALAECVSSFAVRR